MEFRCNVLGLWNRDSRSGLRWDRYPFKTSTGHREEPGTANILPFEWSSVESIPPWWFFVVSTAPGSFWFNSKHLAPSAVVTSLKIDFFMAACFSLSRLPKYKEINSHAVCIRARGSRVEASASSPYLYNFWMTICTKRLFLHRPSYLSCTWKMLQVGIYCFICMTEHIVVKNAEFLVVWRGFKMSVQGGSDRQQAGFFIIAAARFPHGNVKFCQTFI